jgi:hypothetical protein
MCRTRYLAISAMENQVTAVTVSSALFSCDQECVEELVAEQPVRGSATHSMRQGICLAREARR